MKIINVVLPFFLSIWTHSSSFLVHAAILSAEELSIQQEVSGATFHEFLPATRGLINQCTPDQEKEWLPVGDIIRGTADWDQYGRSVDLSGDGTIFAVGATNDDAGGLVRIFERRDNNWVQVGQNINGKSGDEHFGWSVSLSREGDIMAAGGPYGNGTFDRSGIVHIYRYNNQKGDWYPLGDDIQGESTGDTFGRSVSLSDDGLSVAIGARSSKYAKIFTFSEEGTNNGEGVWVQKGQTLRSSAHFGGSLSLSGDASIVIIGAYYEAKVYQFSTDSNQWTLFGTFQRITYIAEESVTISSDGSTIAVRGVFAGETSDLIRVYRLSQNAWAQIGNSIASYSSTVKLSEDGNILAVGEPYNSYIAERSGRAQVFRFKDDNWEQIGDYMYSGKSGSDAYWTYYGGTIAVTRDGQVVAAGAAPSDNYAGLASIFEFSCKTNPDDGSKPSLQPSSEPSPARSSTPSLLPSPSPSLEPSGVPSYLPSSNPSSSIPSLVPKKCQEDSSNKFIQDGVERNWKCSKLAKKKRKKIKKICNTASGTRLAKDECPVTCKTCTCADGADGEASGSRFYSNIKKGKHNNKKCLQLAKMKSGVKGKICAEEVSENIFESLLPAKTMCPVTCGIC